MALPVIPNIAHIQVVMKGSSGLPKDQYVNNLYWRTGTGKTVADQAQDLATWLDACFGEVHAPGTGTLDNYISDEVTSVEYRFYDLGNTLPRYPVVEPITAAWVGQATQRLPQEVALCLSFQSARGPRHRGRIYVGPLGTIGANVATGRPNANLGRVMLGLGRALIDPVGTAGVVVDGYWVQVSGADQRAERVRTWWVDNEWDTQRSRGLEPTGRGEWTQVGNDTSPSWTEVSPFPT